MITSYWKIYIIFFHQFNFVIFHQFYIDFSKTICYINTNLYPLYSKKALYIASFEVIQGAFKILTLLKIYVIIYLA